jgi:hypothetical protein
MKGLDVLQAACHVILGLKRENEDSLVDHCQSLLESATPNLGHRHAPVRLATIQTIQALVCEANNTTLKGSHAMLVAPMITLADSMIHT